MRVGYGYNRTERDFGHLSVDRVFIDLKGTKRAERADMFDHLLRSGDVVVLLSEKDLGFGREIAPLKTALAALGVTIEVDPHRAAKPKQPTPRGMSDEAVALAKIYWPHSQYSIEYILDRLADKGFGPFTRNQLNYKLGPRYPEDD